MQLPAVSDMRMLTNLTKWVRHIAAGLFWLRIIQMGRAVLKWNDSFSCNWRCQYTAHETTALRPNLAPIYTCSVSFLECHVCLL